MTLETTAPGSHLSFSAIDAAVQKRVAPLLKFATGAEVGRAPAGIVAPHTRAEWRAITPSARVAHITAGIKAQVIEAPAHRSRAAGAVARVPRPVRSTAAPVVVVEVAPVASAAIAPTASSWFVSCAGLCGQMIPARSGKPVLAFCTSHPAQRRSARMKPNDDDDDVLVMVRARAKAVCRVTGSTAN